jgi:hypothetical protein
MLKICYTQVSGKFGNTEEMTNTMGLLQEQGFAENFKDENKVILNV